MAEQPISSSEIETDVSEVPETPEVEATDEGAEAEPAVAAGDERSQMIPRQRFDETYARMKQAEELLTQILAQPAAPEKEPEDPLVNDVKQVKEAVFSLRDERDREAFWKENAEFAPAQADVEKELANFRRAGYDVNREQVLDYFLGQKTRREVKAKASAPRSPAPAINQVAHAESGPTSRKVGKDLSQMSEAELLAHEQKNPGALAEYLRGKTF